METLPLKAESAGFNAGVDLRLERTDDLVAEVFDPAHALQLKHSWNALELHISLLEGVQLMLAKSHITQSLTDDERELKDAIDAALVAHHEFLTESL